MSQPFHSAPPAQETASQGELLIRKPFDYAALDVELAQQVQTTAQRIRERVKHTIEVLIAVGKDLMAVKQALPHGSFGPWLRTEFGWAERTARNFMIVAQRFGPKSAIIADLPIDPTAAYLLAAPSTPEAAIATALRRAQNGERITASRVKEILGAFRSKSERRKPASSSEWPTGKLWGPLLEALESFRRRRDLRQIAVLARQLRDFADSLEGNEHQVRRTARRDPSPNGSGKLNSLDPVREADIFASTQTR